MAATMHAKIHRRKLDKLNIIKICEEILNPSVPMALRLSGILMGGVVIVYERKVKLLFDDVTRLLVEINEAWKVKTAPSDPTRLPKGKSKAKYESVTLPANRNEDLGEVEESDPYSNATTIMGFQQNSYFAMTLDNVDDPFLNQNQGDINEDQHQADAANITINDTYNSFQTDGSTFNRRYERFDIEGDEEKEWNPTPPEHTEIPAHVPSPPRPMPSPYHPMSPPPRPEEQHMPNEIQKQHPEELVKQQAVESKENNMDQMRQRQGRRRENRRAAFAMDYEQTIIPGPIYQSWLQNSSDIVSGRGRKRKRPMTPFSMMKIGTLIDLPSVVLVEKLITSGHKVHYPTPLWEQWIRSIQPPLDSPSGRASHPLPPEPSSTSPPEKTHFMEPTGDPFEEFQGIPIGTSAEKQRVNVHENEMPPKIPIQDPRNNLNTNGFGTHEANGVSSSNANPMATPGNSGDELGSIHSSGSGHGFVSHNLDVNSGRSAKKRPFSASKNSGNGLEPVAEDLSWQHPEPNFKLSKPSEYEFTPDQELYVETGPTQTQKHPDINQPLDQTTNSIRIQLKTYFDTPGSAKDESLNQLALGMNKKRAAVSIFIFTNSD
ncbi:hypothetical protein ACS0TY_001068 [Phlomoides rotata]